MNWLLLGLVFLRNQEHLLVDVGKLRRREPDECSFGERFVGLVGRERHDFFEGEDAPVRDDSLACHDSELAEFVTSALLELLRRFLFSGVAEGFVVGRLQGFG